MGTKARLFAATLATLAAARAVAWFANPVYWSRYLAVAAKGGSGDVDSYSPTEPVAGDHDGFLSVAPEVERTVPADALAAAREYAARNRSSSLLIWHRGRLQSADYWGGDAATPVNSRSLHKMLGGLLVGAAIRDGHIASLDDPVANYVTEWQGTPKAAITIRHVLQMSSGLMWFRGGGAYSLPSRRYLDPHWDHVLLEEVPFEFEPGSAWDYSDITADVMPHLIERATGQRYAQYLGDAILKPLQAPGGRLWVNREGGMPHGGCCLMLPPEAWLRIGVMTLNGGRVGEREILPPWWLDEMRKPSPNNPHFGLMVWLGQPYTQRRLFHRPDSPANANPRPGAFHSEPYLADDLFLFDGMNGQIVYLVPSQQLVIVRTGLRPPAGQPEWDNSVLPNLVLRALAAGAATTAAAAAEAPSTPPASAATPAAAPARHRHPHPHPHPHRQPRVRPHRRLRKPRRGPPLSASASPASGASGRAGGRSRRRPRSRCRPGSTSPRRSAATSGPNCRHAPTAERGIPAASLAAAEAYAAKTQSLSLLVWRDGAIEYEKYWNGRGPDDVSETYSMAKSVLGLAIGRAIADGAIGSVDDAVAKYVTEWRGTAKETLTIRQLLQMSSGLRHERFNYSLPPEPVGDGAAHLPRPGHRGERARLRRHARARRRVQLQQRQHPAAADRAAAGDRPPLCRLRIRTAVAAAGREGRDAVARSTRRHAARVLLLRRPAARLAAARRDDRAARPARRSRNPAGRPGSTR